MASLFVFTAGNAEAQEHLEQSIKNPTPPEKVLSNFEAPTYAHLVEIQNQASGFYAWGATPGPQNDSRWQRMQQGDTVLCVYGSAYHYVAHVLGKFRNARCAKAIWGTDAEDQTWEYMYFLSKPVEVNRPLSELSEELNERYMGFTQIADEKVQRLIERYGSLEAFVEQKLLNSRPARVWIFQANPDRYDLRGAATKLREETWTVAEHFDKTIKRGDRVYLWESGSDGGIVATAEVLDHPSLRPLPEASRPFVKDSRFEGDQLRVGLAIRQVFDPVVPRRLFRQHPSLQNLSILRFAQGTNFPVTSEEAKVINDLIAGQGNAGAPDLRSLDGLRRLFEEFRQAAAHYAKWHEELSPFLERVSASDQATRATLEFQKLVWDDNPVSSLGRGGRISVDAAIATERFRNWVAVSSLQSLPTGFHESIPTFEKLYSDLIEGLAPHCQRLPHVKVFRVMAAFFPKHFTALVDRDRLKALHAAMFGDEGDSPVARHLDIVQRVADALGPVASDASNLAWRMMFPWHLYKRATAIDEAPDDDDSELDTLDYLADRLFLDRQELSQIDQLLSAKKQIIFYGPPGTGKTFVARELARFIAGSADRVEIVQFHASYAYEDFVEGYRPALIGNRPGFELTAGPLKRIAEKARRDPKLHVLMIDELNRGNVAKVFGELYYLLEYRDEGLALQYSRERFKRPPICESSQQ